MNKPIWILGSVACVCAAWAVMSSEADRSAAGAPPQIAAEDKLGAAVPAASNSGFALATAAFGMSALQPETYNGDMVFEIIQASPLAEAEKLRLVGALAQAESDDAKLSEVLTTVRVALAVE